ncbi:hypothetical protein CEP53_011928 [Fusarium sp. AF-6]|nr:hypothetical protein CEP53_011928 [Fusarium sp. AF-6]
MGQIGLDGKSHLAVLVTIQEQQYLVDVGHGSACPTKPIPLVANTVISGIHRQQLRLEYKSLPEHTDKSQRVWVYSHRENDESSWVDAYCFTEQECLTTDFEVMNHFPMTSPQSLFTQNVLAQRFLADDNVSQLVGSVILFRDRLKLSMPKAGVTEHILKSEAERVAAIERWFRIQLDVKDRRGIQGSPNELGV